MAINYITISRGNGQARNPTRGRLGSYRNKKKKIEREISISPATYFYKMSVKINELWVIFFLNFRIIFSSVVSE